MNKCEWCDEPGEWAIRIPEHNYVRWMCAKHEYKTALLAYFDTGVLPTTATDDRGNTLNLALSVVATNSDEIIKSKLNKIYDRLRKLERT